MRALAGLVVAILVLGVTPVEIYAQEPPIGPDPPVEVTPLEPPALVAPPRIVGKPRKGERLRCDTGDWLNTPTAFAVQWVRVPALVELGTGPTHVVTGEDVGGSVSCLVEAWNEAGSETAWSREVPVGRIAVSVEHRTSRAQTGPVLRFAGRVRTERPLRAGVVEVFRRGVRVAQGAPSAYGGFRLDVPVFGLIPGTYDFVLAFTPTDDELYESSRQQFRITIGTPPTFPFPRSRVERRPTLFDDLPRFWSDGLPCSVGCRPVGARAGWPLEPFDAQHPLRAGLNELRDSGFHLGIDIQAKAYSRVYAIQPGRVRILKRFGGEARVQVGNYVYWHLKILVRDGEYVSAYGKPLGIVLRWTRHLHLSELDEPGAYLNPLRPGGRVLEPWADLEPPVIGRPTLRADGSVTVAAFDPQSFVVRTSYETPVLAPAALAWRAYGPDGRPLAPLRWVLRGSRVLADGLIQSIFMPSARRPGFLCFALRVICVPRWEYRFAPDVGLGGGASRLTVYAWDWFGNVTARDVWLGR